MSEDAIPTWDEESTYDERIAPLMTQIIAVCKERRIPMFASFAYGQGSDGGTDFCTTSLPVKERPVPELDRCCREVYRPRAQVVALTITGKPS